MSHSFITSLKASLLKMALFRPEDDLLLAVSGGIDSMCLLHALQKLHKGKIEVAHINYKLRGDESDLDAELVRTYCKNNSLSCHIKVYDLSQINSGIQETARMIRYEWFEQLRADRSLNYIVTAHHADDQTETVLQRLIRGTGLKGLTGIPAKSGNTLRPMLAISRDLIEQYQSDENIPYRHDVSNSKNDYTRNFIRNEILPPLHKYYEDLPFGFTTSISNLKNEWGLMEGLLRSWAKDYVKGMNGYYLISIPEMHNIKQKETLLYHLLEGKLESEFIHQLFQSNESGLRFDQAYFSILRDRDYIIIRPYSAEVLNEKISGEGTYQIETSKLTITKSKNVKFSNDSLIEYAMLSREEFPLHVRNWKQGDRFQPLGMEGKSKLLSDFFIDERIHSFQKEEVPILVNDKGQIIWVMGHRLDERFKINKHDPKQLYRLHFKKGANNSASQSFKYLP